MWSFVLWSLWSLAALISPASAAVPVATAAEAATIASGSIALRPIPSNDGTVRVIGLTDVNAGPDAVWAAVLDFESRFRDNPDGGNLTRYGTPTPTDSWVRWEVHRFGFTIVYYNHYRIDRASGTLIHELDPNQSSDLAHSYGEYHILPSPADASRTRLTYQVETRFGRAAPAFIQEWMANSGVRDFLADLKRRAEG